MKCEEGVSNTLNLKMQVVFRDTATLKLFVPDQNPERSTCLSSPHYFGSVAQNLVPTAYKPGIKIQRLNPCVENGDIKNWLAAKRTLRQICFSALRGGWRGAVE